MSVMILKCDRCKEHKPGEVYEGTSCGFYVVSEMPGECNYWANFARSGERLICDACMWSDPRYVAEFGERK